MAGLFQGAPPPFPDQSSRQPPPPSDAGDAPVDDGRLPSIIGNSGRLASILGLDDAADEVPIVAPVSDREQLPFPPKARPDRPQTISDAGLQFLKSHEVVKEPVLLPKNDGVNNPTIGFGHKLRDGEAELFKNGIDRETAEQLFRNDVAEAERTVRRRVSVSLKQGQYDALVSLVYNWGSGNFARSDLLRLLNAGDYEAAGNEIPKLVYATDQETKQRKFLPGYVPRRQGEQKMFLSDD